MANSIRARVDACWSEVAEGGAFWSWGDDDGLMPWGDRLRRTGVPLWSSERLALTENVNDADDGRPLEFSVPALVEMMVRWHERREEIVIFLQPVDGRIMVTLTLEEFAEEVKKRLATDRVLLTELLDKLNAMARDARPRLP